jgi:hypothetical protein
LRWLIAVVRVRDGCGERAIELLLALFIPACKEEVVVAVGRADGKSEAPGKGNGVAEAGGDALAADCRVLDTKVGDGWGGGLQGGNTCAASPVRMTRLRDQRLQLRAEKEKERERMHSIQSAGQETSSESLLYVSIVYFLFRNLQWRLRGHKPVFLAWMAQVREDDLACLLLCSHDITVLALLDDKLKTPEPVLRAPEAAADRGAGGVANKIESGGEEEVIHLFWCVPLFPERKFGM